MQSQNKNSTVSQRHAFSANQKWTMASTTAGFALENMDVMFLSFALSSIIADLHISGAAGGMMSSITNLGMLMGGVLFGLLADKFGRVKVFSHTILIFAFATAAMFFANNITFIYILRFLAGVGAGGEYGAGVALIAENFPKGKLAKLNSISAIGGQVGAIIAAGVAAFLLPRLGWHFLFLIGLIPVIFAYIIRKNLKESPDFVKRQQSSTDQAKNHVSIKELFNTPKKIYQTTALTLMVIVQIAGYLGLMNWLPSIMQKKLGVSASGSSIWMIVTIIGMSIGMMTFSSIMDKFGPRLSYGIFLIAAAIALYLILLAFNTWTLLFASTIVGFFSNGMYGGYGAIISRLYPTNIRATANNFIMNVGRAIGGFSPVVIGLLMDHSTLSAVMISLSAMYIISLLVMLTIPDLKNFNQIK